MKKFSFPLNSVLRYKDQILNSLKNEYGIIVMEVSKQQEKIRNLNLRYKEMNEEFNSKKVCGIAVHEIHCYESYLRSLEKEIEKELFALQDLKKAEEEKQKEVINAKVESASIVKLKDKKLEAYKKEVQKNEELFIEEFVSNCRATNV